MRLADRPKHTARVLLHEARARRGTAFSHVLLHWAGNARRRAAETAPTPTTPTQQELFQ
jgi:hypothetical protein